MYKKFSFNLWCFTLITTFLVVVSTFAIHYFWVDVNNGIEYQYGHNFLYVSYQLTRFPAVYLFSWLLEGSGGLFPIYYVVAVTINNLLYALLFERGFSVLATVLRKKRSKMQPDTIRPN